MTLINITIFTLLFLSFPYTTLTQDNDKKDSKKETTPSLLPFKKLQRPRRAAKTKQERKEQEILQAFDDLFPIAEGLAKFTQSKEAQETIKAKTQERDQIEKKAEQLRKQREQHRGFSGRSYSNSSSGSGYRSGGSSYGSGGYGGGYGGGSYGGGYSNGWGTRPSGFPASRSSTLANNTTPFEGDKTVNEEEDEAPSEKKKEKKNKHHGGSWGAPGRKEAEEAYAEATNAAKKAADSIESALKASIADSETQSAAKLLTDNSFDLIKTSIESSINMRGKIRADEFANLESGHKNQYATQVSRVNGLCAQLWPKLLLAATLTPHEAAPTVIQPPQQDAAAGLLKSQIMKKFINENAITKRVNDIAGNFNYQAIDTAIANAEADNFAGAGDAFNNLRDFNADNLLQNMDAIFMNFGNVLPGFKEPVRKPPVIALNNRPAIRTHFSKQLKDRKTVIDNLMNKLPIVPLRLSQESTTLGTLIQRCENLPD